MSKLRVDMADLTLRDMDVIADYTDGEALDVAMQGAKRGRAIAAAVYVIHRRADPTFTFEQAYDMSPLRDFELVGAEEQDTPKGGNGVEPPPSLVSGG